MKKLSDLTDDTLLTVVENGYDCKVMTIDDFRHHRNYIDRDDVDVAIADEVAARFDLESALESMQDDMYEDWLYDALNAIPKGVMTRIEAEINSYLEKIPTYYPGEKVDWKS